MATTFPTYPATSFEQAVDLTIFSSNQLGGIINGDGKTEVETLDGNIPSVRKALLDNFYFKTPIDWKQGTTETVFNQLRFFSNGILSAWYYAPTATTSNPIPMGSTPVGDANWVIYQVQQQVLPAEVYPWLYDTATGSETEISPPYVFDSAIVTINGVVQISGKAYTISDSKIILNEPLGVDPDSGNPNLLFAYLGKVEASTNDYVQSTILASNIGASMIGEVGSCTTLRTLLPTRTNQRVEVKGYVNGTAIGGGKFYYVADSVLTDDGGTFFRVNAQGGWKRATPEVNEYTIVHFGAQCDGKTNDADAIVRMHNWSMAQGGNFGPGVILPPGTTAVDVVNLGTAEISCFKIRGPQREYGHLVSATLVPFSTTQTTPMFTFCARRMEVSNLHLLGTGTVQPFFVNTVTRGAFARVHSIRADGIGGRAFQLIDTLDCKFDQIYSYDGKKAFLWVTWSNLSPGAWDHPTAIELSNFNFNSHTTEYAVSAIRAGQSMMYNGWFDHCEYPFDISQGGWTLDNVTMENSTYAAATKYAKVIEINCRWAQGAGLDNTLSGYTQDMDLLNGGSGNMPSWVTNLMDQGYITLDPTGSNFKSGVASYFNYSDTVLVNSTNQDTWFHVARVTQQGRGRTAHLRLIGSSGWDAVGDNVTLPTATTFGGGQADIYIELKYPDVENSLSGQVHWYGQGNCPIKEVRYVHSWQTIQVYVKVAAYALNTVMFAEGNGDPRTKSGTPFYVVPYNEVLTQAQIDALTNIQKAPARWAINAGNYSGAGIGMDLESSKLLLNAATVVNAASTHLVVTHQGTDRYIPLQVTNQSNRIPVYAYADLPSAATNVYGMVLCRDTTLTPPMQPLFSNGTTYYLMSDPSNTSWRPATT